MTKKITDFFALESNYPDLDAEGAVARLSQAIQCRTINYACLLYTSSLVKFSLVGTVTAVLSFTITSALVGAVPLIMQL